MLKKIFFGEVLAGRADLPTRFYNPTILLLVIWKMINGENLIRIQTQHIFFDLHVIIP
jgi:hypothetical protein